MNLTGNFLNKNMDAPVGFVALNPLGYFEP